MGLPAGITRMIVTAAAAVAVSGLLFMSCGDNPASSEPQEPDFHISSVLFTGDSVGTGTDRDLNRGERSERRRGSRGTPYCEVTVDWTFPDCRVTGYSLHRSTEPGVTGDDRVVATTVSESQAVDSDSLEWGTTYYYSVSAMTSDSTVLWSDEGSITTPNSQLPTPSVLSATPLPLGRCELTWTECPEDDFVSYTLLRSRYPDSYHPDTMVVLLSANETSFTDTLPPIYSPRYYRLVTTDSQEISVDSNILEYSDGYGLPWYTKRVIHGNEDLSNNIIVEDTMIHSWFEDMIYYVEKEFDIYSGLWYWCVRRVYTGTGLTHNVSLGNQMYGEPRISHSPDEDQLLAARQNPDDSSDLLLLDDRTLSIEDSIHFDSWVNGLLAVPGTGKALVRLQGTYNTLVLDLYSVQVVDTLDFSFTYGQMTETGNLYIWGGGSSNFRRLDPQTFGVLASTPLNIAQTQLITAENGDICLAYGSTVWRLDPLDLSTVAIYSLPVSTGAALYVTGDTLYAYLYYDDSDEIRVIDLETSEEVGSVMLAENILLCELYDILVLRGKEQLWCSAAVIDEYFVGAFNIVR